MPVSVAAEGDVEGPEAFHIAFTTTDPDVVVTGPTVGVVLDAVDDVTGTVVGAVPPTVVVTSTPGAEPPDGDPVDASFTLHLVDPAGAGGDVTYATTDGPAPGVPQATPGADFTPVASTVASFDEQGRADVVVDVLADADRAEGAEQFGLAVEGDGVVVLPASPAGGTILDAKPPTVATPLDPPFVSVADAEAAEGDDGDDATLDFVVTLSNAVAEPVTVTAATQDGTATAGADYEAVSEEVVFAPGETAGLVQVPVVHDDEAESDEALVLALSDPEGANLALVPTDGRAAATGTIHDDDDLPEVVPPVDDPTETPTALLSPAAPVTEGDAAVLTFPIRLSTAAGPGGAEITWATDAEHAAASATPDVDYEAASGTVVIPEGAMEPTEPITVAVIDDDEFESETPLEAVFVRLTGATGAQLLPAVEGVDPNAAPGIVVDDDAGSAITALPPIVVVTSTPGVEEEAAGVAVGGADVMFTLVLVNPVGDPVDVHYATASAGTLPGVPQATPGEDFEPVESTPAVFENGVAQAMVTVTGDDLSEGPEQIGLEVTAPDGTLVVPLNPAAGVILDADAEPPSTDVPTVSIQGPTLVDEGAGSAEGFLAVLNTPSPVNVDVNYSTADGDATNGDDYTGVDGTVVIPQGETQAPLPDIAILEDGLFEADQTFTYQIDQAVGALVSDTAGAVVTTIRDNEAPPVFSIAPAPSAPEGDADTGTLDIEISIDVDTEIDVMVNYATSDVTATAGDDYEAAPENATATVPGGTRSTTVPIVINGDTAVEPDETFAVTLSNPVGGTIGVGEAVATITDDDRPTLTLADVSVAEGSTARFTLTLSKAVSTAVSVRVSTAPGTVQAAEAGSDYTPVETTVSFPAGTTEKTVDVPTRQDSLDEAEETLQLVLSQPVDLSLARTAAVAVITDDDAPPVLSMAGDEVQEGDGDATVSFTLSAPSGRHLSVAAATEDRTARAGQDYEPVAARLHFPPGTTAASLAVPLHADDEVEDDETFRVTLVEDPAHLQLAARSATVTITDGIGTAEPRGNTTPSGKGYVVVRPDGGVQGFGDASDLTSASAASDPDVEAIAVAITPSAKGYWLLDHVGGVLTHGDARFFGSVAGRKASGDVPAGTRAVDIAATPSGKGYYVLDEAGGVHAFGDARYLGSLPGLAVRGLIGTAPAVSIAVTPSGQGYAVLDRAGGVHTFGDARFFGSLPGLRQSGVAFGDAAAASIAFAPGGHGYWVLDEAGGVFTFGTARFLGSLPGLRGAVGGAAPALAIEATAAGDGYWVFDTAGGVFTFGAARFAGSLPGLTA